MVPRRVFGFILLISILASMAHIAKTSYKTYQSSLRVASLGQEVQTLKEQNKQLSKEIELRKSSSYIEEVARNKLNMSQPGETLVVIQEEMIAETQMLSQEVAQRSPWEQWRLLLLGEIE